MENAPSRYVAIWKEAKQTAVESNTTYSIDEYHPAKISAGNWVSALEDLETIIKQENSGETDMLRTEQESSTESPKPRSCHNQQDKADPDSSHSSSDDEPRVPIEYQQLWSKTNRLLNDLDYDESLANFHPDSVSPGQWDTAYERLEARYDALRDKKVESLNPGSAQHQTTQTNQNMFQSRLEMVIDADNSDLSPAGICEDHQQLTNWLEIWARWEGLRRLAEIERVAAPVSNSTGVGDQLADSLHLAGYETLGEIRNASVADLQEVDGIGEQRAQTLYEAASTRPVGNIQGVGKILEQELLNAGIRTALDLTAVSQDTLTAIDGIGEQRGLQLQGRAAAWLPPQCDPPSELYDPYQPPYQSLSNATENVDQLERVLYRYSEVEPLLSQLRDSSLTVPDDVDLGDILLEKLVLNPPSAPEDTIDTGESTWHDVVQTLATVVADQDERPDYPSSVRTQFDLTPVQTPDINFVDIWSVDTPAVALEQLMELKQKTKQVREFIETARGAVETHAQIQASSSAAASRLEAALTQHVTRLQAAIGSDSFVETRDYVTTYSEVCASTISLAERYPSYPFESILRSLSGTDQSDSIPEATLQDFQTILQTADEALAFMNSVDYNHPAVDQDSWEESLRLSLTEEYPQAIQPVTNQLSRLDDGVWDSDDLAAYEWQSFERLVGHLYRDEGYETTVTQSTNDLGVDIWVKKADRRLAIQVKHYQAGQSVGRKTLQQLVSTLAAGDANEAIVVTSGEFADTAQRYADDFGDELSLVGASELIRRLSESSIPPKPG
ncbi:hypothetical protein DJ82_13795 [Halorubrum sp. Ib24]|nr:hypothetical protein DJ82_13795 [Halorubrum sp. Ib24]